MRITPKPLLVVTEDTASINIPARKNMVCVANVARLFPAIHELQPCGIILDYDYMGTDTEKILRRIRSNPFYNNLKIYCYKSKSHTKVDDLLRTLGVQQFIYGTDTQPKVSTSAKLLHRIMEAAVVSTLAEASYN